jgi:hypothetical protein
MFTAAMVAIGTLVAGGAAQAHYVAPFTANDTGGIISYSLAGQTDIHALAADHCARYGKAVRLTGVQATQGGYISFRCVWVPPPRFVTALRVRY